MKSRRIFAVALILILLAGIYPVYYFCYVPYFDISLSSPPTFVYAKGKNLYVDKSKIVQEIISTKTMINLNYEEMKSPIEMVMPKLKEKYEPTLKDNIFLISSLTLGTLITLFTFLWGFL